MRVWTTAYRLKISIGRELCVGDTIQLQYVLMSRFGLLMNQISHNDCME